MRTFAPILLLAGAAVLAEEAPAKPVSVPFTTIDKGSSSGLKAPLQEAVTGEKAWKALWARHVANRQPEPKLPEVDFSKEIVLAVASVEHRSGGYSIGIVSVEKKGNGLKVHVCAKGPPPQAMVTEGFTQPHHFVRIPKPEGPVEFVNES